MNTLKQQYFMACDAYAAALNSLWETEGEWVGDDYQTFDVADCFISNAEMRFCVDNKISFDAFLEWYEYDMGMHYGMELKKPEAHRIVIQHWFKNYPEELKIPKRIWDQWEKEYFADDR